MIAGIKTENGPYQCNHTPRRFVIRKLGFDTVYLCAKFHDSSFSHCRDITGDPKI